MANGFFVADLSTSNINLMTSFYCWERKDEVTCSCWTDHAFIIIGTRRERSVAVSGSCSVGDRGQFVQSEITSQMLWSQRRAVLSA